MAIFSFIAARLQRLYAKSIVLEQEDQKLFDLELVSVDEGEIKVPDTFTPSRLTFTPQQQEKP